MKSHRRQGHEECTPQEALDIISSPDLNSLPVALGAYNYYFYRAFEEEPACEEERQPPKEEPRSQLAEDSDHRFAIAQAIKTSQEAAKREAEHLHLFAQVKLQAAERRAAKAHEIVGKHQQPKPAQRSKVEILSAEETRQLYLPKDPKPRHSFRRR